MTRLMTDIRNLDGLINVQIIKYINPGRFMGKESYGENCSEECRTFHQMEVALNNYMNNDQMPNWGSKDPAIGEICVGKIKNNNSWVRVKVEGVLHTHEGRTARCLLIDYGEPHRTITFTRLRDLPERFSTLNVPPQAREFILYGIQPVTLQLLADQTLAKRPCKKWDAATDRFINKLKRDYTSARMQIKKTNSQGRSYCVLWMRTVEGHVNVNQALVDEGYACLATEEPDMGYGTSTDDDGLRPPANRQLPAVDNELFGYSSDDGGGGTRGSSGAVHKDSKQDEEEEFEQKIFLSRLPDIARKNPKYKSARIVPSTYSLPLYFMPGQSRSKTKHQPEIEQQITTDTCEDTKKSRRQSQERTAEGVRLSSKRASPNSRSFDRASSVTPPKGRGKIVAAILSESSKVSNEPTTKSIAGRGAFLQTSPKQSQDPTPKSVIEKGRGLQWLSSGEDITKAKSSHVGDGDNVNPFMTPPKYYSGRAASSMESRQSDSDDYCSIPMGLPSKASERADSRFAINLGQGDAHSVGPPLRRKDSFVSEQGDSSSFLQKKRLSMESSQNFQSLPIGRGRGIPGLTPKSKPMVDAKAKPPNMPMYDSEQFMDAVENSQKLQHHQQHEQTVQNQNKTFSQKEVLPKTLHIGRGRGITKLSPPRSNSKGLTMKYECSPPPLQTESPPASPLQRQTKMSVLDRLRLSTSQASSSSISPSLSPLKETQLQIIRGRGVSSPTRDTSRTTLTVHSPESRSSPRLSGTIGGENVLCSLNPGAVVRNYQRGVATDSSSEGFTREPKRRLHQDVFMDGDFLQQQAKRVQDLPFSSENLKKKIAGLEITAANLLQSYAWPAILRGRNFVGVAPRRKGKKLSYLLPLISCITQPNTYVGLGDGIGPYALILCPYWKKARDVYDKCTFLLQNQRTTTPLLIFGAGNEENMEIPLLNGCDILIATPHCLLRMIEKGVTSLHKLCHLVLEDASDLTEEFTDQVKEILEIYEYEQAKRSHGFKQFVMCSQQWSPGMESFMKTYIEDPLVVLASKSEAAIYGKVGYNVITCQDSQKVTQLIRQLDPVVSGSFKTVVFTSNPETSLQLCETLRAQSHYVLCITQYMDYKEQQKIQSQWNSSHGGDSQPILVMSDDALDDIVINDAMQIIHFDICDGKDKFGKRLGCMKDHFKKIISKDENTKVQPMSHIIVSPSCAQKAPHLVRLLKRLNVTVSPLLQKLAEGRLEGKEEIKAGTLCHYVKAFGFCRHEDRCPERHIISKTKDLPGGDPRFIKVPQEGKVKVKITHIRDATCYYGRLLEYTDSEGKTDISTAYMKLCSETALWFLNPSKKKRTKKLDCGAMFAFETKKHTYERCVVKKIVQISRDYVISSVEVEFVDIGQWDIVDAERLYDLPEHLKQYQYQVVEIFITRVKPLDKDLDWTDITDGFVHRTIFGKELVGKIQLSLGRTMWLDPLREIQKLKSINGYAYNPNIRLILFDEEYAIENPEHLRLLNDACGKSEDDRILQVVSPSNILIQGYTTKGLPVSGTMTEYFGESQRVFLSTLVDPGMFYIRLLCYDKLLRRLLDEIETHINVNDVQLTKDDVLREGTFVLARIPEENRWNRGKIVALGKDGCDILFLDYGDQLWLKSDNILPMPKKFLQLPFQALECSLYGIEPLENNWSDEAADHLIALSRDHRECELELNSKLNSMRESSHLGQKHHVIDLFCKSRFDINLKKELIASGHAKLILEELKEMFHCSNKENQIWSSIVPRCQALLITNDVDSRKDLATHIFKMLMESSQEDLQEIPVIEYLLDIISYMSEVTVTCEVITCLTKLADCNDSVTAAFSSCNGDQTLCWLLRKFQADDQLLVNAILQCMLVFAKTQSCKDLLVQRGALKLVSDIITKTQQEACIQNCLTLLYELIESICDLQVDNEACIQSLCLMMLNYKELSTENLLALSKLMDKIALHKIWKESVRKEKGLKALCDALKDSDDIKLKEAFLLTLKALANNSHANKSAILEMKMTPILKHLEKEGTISKEAQSICKDLVERLKEVIPSRASRMSGSESLQPLLPPGAVAVPVNVSEPIGNKPIRKVTGIIKSKAPHVMWAQDKYNLLLTVKVAGIEESDCVRYEEDRVIFRTVAENIEYHFDFKLYEVIKPTMCEVKIASSVVYLGLKKAHRGIWPRLLKHKDRGKQSCISHDLERFEGESSKSEDDSEVDAATASSEDASSPLERLLKRKTMKTPFELAGPSKIERTESIEAVPEWMVDSSSDSESSDEDDFIRDPYDIFGTRN